MFVSGYLYMNKRYHLGNIVLEVYCKHPHHCTRSLLDGGGAKSKSFF